MMLKLNGGRCVTGILRGFDPFMNVVIDETVEECRDGTKNTIGMVVSSCFISVKIRRSSVFKHISSLQTNNVFLFHTFQKLQVIRGNSIVMVEGLERV